MNDKFVYMISEGNIKKYKDGWSKWRTPEQWVREMKAEPNYEFVVPKKLCIETDYEDPKTNKQVILHVKKLFDKKGVAYKIYFTGNKSYHCESIWEGLEKIVYEKRPKAKAMLAEWLTNKELSKDFDTHNYGNKAMFQIPGKPHRKTRKLKTIVWERPGTNKLPQEIIEAVNKEPEATQKIYDTPAPTQCHFLEYCLDNRIDLENKQQNKNLSPNAWAYFKGNQGLLQKLVDTQQQPGIHFALARINCWAQYKPEFNCKQVQVFAGSVGKRSICDLCLLEGKK